MINRFDLIIQSGFLTLVTLNIKQYFSKMVYSIKIGRVLIRRYLLVRHIVCFSFPATSNIPSKMNATIVG